MLNKDDVAEWLKEQVIVIDSKFSDNLKKHIGIYQSTDGNYTVAIIDDSDDEIKTTDFTTSNLEVAVNRYNSL